MLRKKQHWWCAELNYCTGSCDIPASKGSGVAVQPAEARKINLFNQLLSRVTCPPGFARICGAELYRL